MKVAILLALLPVIIYALTVEQSFHSWTQLHGKQYSSQNEYNYRLSVYRKNLDFIENHNRKNLNYKVAMNKFGDLTVEEYRAQYLGMKIDASKQVQKGNIHRHNPSIPRADEVDWRAKGAVTEIKNQGQCGSCWAFSTTGSLEGAWFLAKGKLVSLSEQNLVDCSGAYGNYGCNGGLMTSAFDYIIANKGIDTEDSYAYTAEDGTCQFDSSAVGATLSNYTNVKPEDEQDLQSAIQQQPVSVAIDASQSSFQFYSSGVYDEPYCSSSQLDHGVLAVGYGTTEDSTKAEYYIVKNSWGTDWGQNGYIWMSRNKNNQCGIATMSTYPTI